MSNALQSTITSKGQVTIPIAVRSKLHLQPGDKIAFTENADGTYILHPLTLSVMSIKGMVRGEKALSLEDMEAAIMRGYQS